MADDVTPEKLQSIDTSILDTIKNDQGSKLLEIAQKEYPYLADKSIAYKYTPSQDFRQLEFYQGEDLPDWAKSTGKQVAIETFNPQTRPIDILGDYVSHYGVKQDPQLMQLYQQFSQSVPQETYQKRLNETIQNIQEDIEKEKNPEQKQMLIQELQDIQTQPQEWWQRAGLPEYFRGYPFKQFGPEEEAKSFYSPELLDILNKVRSYLNVK
jgi:hypothetical protein